MDKKEIRDWIIQHCKNKNGDIDLDGLDFSQFNGDVFIGHMKVKHDLHQGSQTAGSYILQSNQTAGSYIFQSNQTARWMLLQDTTGMEKDKDGYWVNKKKTLEERINESNLDEDLKKGLIAKIKEGVI